MSGVCPSHEVDELTISLLNIFEARGMSFVLLEALIKQEIEETGRLLSFAGLQGFSADTLSRKRVGAAPEDVRRHQDVVDLRQMEGLRLPEGHAAERGREAYDDLQGLESGAGSDQGQFARGTADQCGASSDSGEGVHREYLWLDLDHPGVVPQYLQYRKSTTVLSWVRWRLLADTRQISESVMERFPDAKYTAVGAFIFLRFFCPAIVAPEVEGLVSAPPSKDMRRGLLLIAKVIQNLANNVLFGAKEPYMFPLIDFLTDNIYKVTTFLREISVSLMILGCGWRGGWG